MVVPPTDSDSASFSISGAAKGRFEESKKPLLPCTSASEVPLVSETQIMAVRPVLGEFALRDSIDRFPILQECRDSEGIGSGVHSFSRGSPEVHRATDSMDISAVENLVKSG